MTVEEELTSKINQLESTVNLLNSRLIAIAKEYYSNKLCVFLEVCQECIQCNNKTNYEAITFYMNKTYTITKYPPITQSRFSLHKKSYMIHFNLSEKYWLHEIESELKQQTFFKCGCKFKVIPWIPFEQQ